MKRRAFLKAIAVALIAPLPALKAMWKPVDPVDKIWPGVDGFGSLRPVGEIVFVDYDKGDDRNTGRSPMEPIKDLNLALSRMEAVVGGEVYILP